MTRTETYRTIAVVVSSAGLLMACGAGPSQPTVVPTPGAAGVRLKVTPMRLEFTGAAGARPVEESLTVSNVSGASMQMPPISISGTDGNPSAVFHREAAVKGDCGATLAAGSSCTVRIVYGPAAAGEDRGWVALEADQDQWLNIPLHGVATAK